MALHQLNGRGLAIQISPATSKHFDIAAAFSLKIITDEDFPDMTIAVRSLERSTTTAMVSISIQISLLQETRKDMVRIRPRLLEGARCQTRAILV